LQRVSVADYRPCMAAPLPVPAPVPTRARVVASEGDITAGALRANDAYDLTLYQMPDGSYELVLFMKLQFFFESGSGGDWTPAEKARFISDYQIAVNNAWSGRRIKRLKSGKHVSVRLDFAVQEGGWMLDHWEITVTKITPGTFRQSYVNVGLGNVVLDSEDLTAVPKAPGSMQRGVVHEFGHMLGLDDEYTAGSPHVGDTRAIMNSGEQLRPRYDETLLGWLDRKLKKLGVE
jgi:hypothetical protein